ncbi:polyadenylate-binding protein-interacting protein 2 [Drosophila subobscura]|uniref:polyadenylate-binding protein-interacting protein 2 n=1 Tax=Drosophila subobscura TaxID=7241 RepID=UPI00155A4522|nr:polyadenylate-binding protein-interacting protein 2 [Drosophila subobscura]
MLLKVPSVDWSEQIIYVIDDDESLSDFDDEPDFSEYMWMENEEEFDKNELQRLEEEEIMQECIEAMMEDELEEQLNEWEKAKTEEQNTALSALPKSQCNVEKSVLNPMADEFVPASLILDLPAAS